MSKIILEFDSIEEQIEANDAINGSKWKIVVWQLDQKLRNTIKYDVSVIDTNKASELERNISEKYRELISDLMSQYGLIFE